MQPCFTFKSEIRLSWPELQTAAATDFREVEQLVKIAFGIRDINLRLLLPGRRLDLEPASNHAAVHLRFGGPYEFGFRALPDALTTPGESHGDLVEHGRKPGTSLKSHKKGCRPTPSEPAESGIGGKDG